MQPTLMERGAASATLPPIQSPMYYMVALTRIEQANLPAPVYRTARRLLDLAVSANGELQISHERCMQLVETSANGTMRSHLIQIERAGIAAYHTNGSIRVWFVDFPKPHWMTRPKPNRANPRAERSDSRDWPTMPEPVLDPENEIDQIRALDDQNRALGDQMRALGDQNRAICSPPIGYWLVGSSIDPDQEEPTNQVGENAGARIDTVSILADDTKTDTVSVLPITETAPTPGSAAPPSPAEQQRNFALLTDPEIALNARVAQICAKVHHFDFLLAQVATYWDQWQKGIVESPGALKNRIMNGWRPEPYTAEFLASALYKRHFPVQLSAGEIETYAAYQRHGAWGDHVIGLEATTQRYQALLQRLTAEERYWLSVLPLPQEVDHA